MHAHCTRIHTRILSCLLLFFGLLAGACSPKTTVSDNKPHIVATTGAWASVAAAIAATDADVITLIPPSSDPHDFTPTPADALTLDKATVVVANGDNYEGHLLDSVSHKNKTITAFSLINSPDKANVHVFLNPKAVTAVAEELTRRLSTIDPGHAGAYKQRCTAFTTGLQRLEQKLASAHKPNTTINVVQTESIGTYLLQIAHVHDLTPPDLYAEGDAVSNQTIYAVNKLLTQKSVKALISNDQAQSQQANSLIKTARQNGIPVVNLAETPPENMGYLDWYSKMVNHLISVIKSE